MLISEKMIFQEYMAQLFNNNHERKICRYEIFAKITSYILKHEHINLVTDIRNPYTVKKLIEKYQQDTTFMADNTNLRNDCIFCLYKYHEYLRYIAPKKTTINEDGKVVTEYLDDEISTNRLF